MKSTAAFFNISLIPLRWYDDKVGQFSEDEIRSLPIIQLCNTQSKSVQTFQSEFSYLRDIREGNIGQESEYINLLKDFIQSMEISLKKVTNEKENSNEIQKITNPIYVKPHSRLPQKCYKSSLE
ncbi:hypothetical protein GLOIN_2v1472538 [Rhizophagus clarus]|uniref:Uncharacterized protein n=1 Tax=Rhizophagus clarus TaxID=94130 RepID=A0A8H3LYG4_9GLOM|nr:hypothetical protein GLOIN_2v1472538 [Rhizophagus clarus]